LGELLYCRDHLCDFALQADVCLLRCEEQRVCKSTNHEKNANFLFGSKEKEMRQQFVFDFFFKNIPECVSRQIPSSLRGGDFELPGKG
jgi:hypothetical protein